MFACRKADFTGELEHAMLDMSLRCVFGLQIVALSVCVYGMWVNHGGGGVEGSIAYAEGIDISSISRLQGLLGLPSSWGTSRQPSTAVLELMHAPCVPALHLWVRDCEQFAHTVLLKLTWPMPGACILHVA